MVSVVVTARLRGSRIRFFKDKHILKNKQSSIAPQKLCHKVSSNIILDEMGDPTASTLSKWDGQIFTNPKLGHGILGMSVVAHKSMQHMQIQQMTVLWNP